MSQLPHATNPFSQAAQQAITAVPPAGAYQDALVTIDQFCDAIEQAGGGKFTCVKIPGFLTNLGQEYRVIINTRRRRFEHLLCRIHVAAAGVPVMLDLYDEDLIPCRSADEVRDELVQFLGRDTTKDVLRTLAAQ